MTEIDTLAGLLDARLAAAEERLARVVNERTTNVIDATTLIAGGLQEDLNGLTTAIDGLSASLAARISVLEETQAELRADMDELADAHGVALPSRSQAPTLRRQIAAVDARARWRFALILAVVTAAEVAQWIYLLWVVTQ